MSIDAILFLERYLMTWLCIFIATTDINIADMEEFLQEAAFMKYYKHINVLKPLGVVWRDGDRPQVVLPYMAQGDLCSLLKKKLVFLFTYLFSLMKEFLYITCCSTEAVLWEKMFCFLIYVFNVSIIA